MDEYITAISDIIHAHQQNSRENVFMLRKLPNSVVHIIYPQYYTHRLNLQISVHGEKLARIFLYTNYTEICDVPESEFTYFAPGIFSFIDMFAFCNFIYILCVNNLVGLAKSVVCNFRHEYKIDCFRYHENKWPFSSYLCVYFIDPMRAQYFYQYTTIPEIYKKTKKIMRMYEDTSAPITKLCDKCYRVGIFDISE